MANPYYNRQKDFVPDTPVRSSDLDDELDAVVRGFDLLSDPSRLNNGSLVYGPDTGTSDNYVVNNGGDINRVEGEMLTFIPAETNTGPSVVSVNGGPNIPIKRNDGGDTQASDLLAGIPYLLIYDLTNNRWVLTGATAQQTKQNFRPAVELSASTLHTFDLADENTIILFSSDNPISVVCPSDASDPLPVGFISHINQSGLGAITVSGEGGVILNYSFSANSRSQHSSISVTKTGVNEWLIVGDVA